MSFCLYKTLELRSPWLLVAAGGQGCSSANKSDADIWLLIQNNSNNTI